MSASKGKLEAMVRMSKNVGREEEEAAAASANGGEG
jgi:hypothetical protein